MYICSKAVSLGLLLLMASPFGVNILQDDPMQDSSRSDNLRNNHDNLKLSSAHSTVTL